MPAVMWFRRDLRLTDHPALSAAAATGPVLPLFVLDPVLLGSAGAPRKAYLSRSLAALDDSLDGRLVIRTGDPATVVPEVAREVGATTVHVSAECTPYGRERDARVSAAGVRLEATGSPYAVTPGRLLTGPARRTRCSRRTCERGWSTAGHNRRTTQLPSGCRPGRTVFPSSRPTPTCRGPGSLPRGHAGRAFSRTRSTTTPRTVTAPTCAGPLTCRCRCASARSIRAPCWQTSPGSAARQPRSSGPSSDGGTSTPTSSGTDPTRPPTRCGRASARWSTTTPARRSTRGVRAEPGSRSSTPGCASCGPPAGCTTGCG